ncbi:MAG TPA: response regulator transcription factor [Flavobacteriales bacterium]|nr:response regulator transcription factor [Flavobacteriales bacterium]
MTPWEVNGTKVDVVLIEDHEAYRSSLEFFLNSSGRVDCRSFQDAEAALSSLETRRPDIVIMDINLPGMDGIACTRKIKERWPAVQVLICTVHEDDEKIFDALRAGATGYILKRTSIDEIIEAIRQVLAGGSPMTPAIARRVVGSFVPPKLNEGLNALSDREQEVLDLLVAGLRVKEIADKLFVSANTVRTHIRHIYEKLQVQSRVEAVNRVRGKG